MLSGLLTLNAQDCEGWWLSGCCGSVAEHWRLKPEVSWVRLTVTASLFHFSLFSPHNIERFETFRLLTDVLKYVKDTIPPRSQ